MDAISEQKLVHVNPKLSALVRQMADELAAADPPVTIRVVQGLRTWEEQAALYDQGRSKPGKIVTDAPAGHSYHNFGLAVDCVPMMPLGPDWNRGHPVWQRMIAVGQKVGLTEGALWRSFPDWPHFQLTGSLPLSPNEYVRDSYIQSGLQGVWTAAGLYSPDQSVNELA